ncbi:MAG: C40 family peptidase [Leptotrichia sp.]|nr:C40 family peptidase [Leptotrichia sp.]
MAAFAFITSGLQGKSVKHKKNVKAKQNTAKTVKTKKTVSKGPAVKNTNNVKSAESKTKPTAAKHSAEKHPIAKTSQAVRTATALKHIKTVPVKPGKTSSVANTAKTVSHNKVSHNTGIYSISANNKEQVIIDKMTELRKKHERIAKSGTASEKRTAAAEKKLLVSYSKWKDTKYAWGGDSKKGIDCSALTRRIYREVYGHELPRVSTQQAQTGKKVSSKNLKAGDIVFFKPEGRTNHTAVYVGNSLFINASSSKGVVMSSLKSPYWGKYFKYGVRVDKHKNT